VLWGRRVRKSNFQKSGVGEGSECENLSGPKPRNLKPRSPKSQKLKFHLESLVAPSSLAFDHGSWMHGLGTKKKGAITQKLQSRAKLEKFVKSKCFLIRVGL
jgi:hypothetical protein